MFLPVLPERGHVSDPLGWRIHITGRRAVRLKHALTRERCETTAKRTSNSYSLYRLISFVQHQMTNNSIALEEYPLADA
jgi:hypothetical protein